MKASPPAQKHVEKPALGKTVSSLTVDSKLQEDRNPKFKDEANSNANSYNQTKKVVREIHSKKDTTPESP